MTDTATGAATTCRGKRRRPGVRMVVHASSSWRPSWCNWNIVLLVLAFLCGTISSTLAFSTGPPVSLTFTAKTAGRLFAASSSQDATTSSSSILSELQQACQAVESTYSKTCKVQVQDTNLGLGLVATQAVSKGEVLLSIPYSSPGVLTADLALQTFAGILPQKYNGWTGDTGLLALLLLNELAQAAKAGGVPLPKAAPKRSAAVHAFVTAWLQALPHPDAAKATYPLLWSEDAQEVLQLSSTTKIYRVLDDIEEDFTWLSENVFAGKPQQFPETVTLNGEAYPCFSLSGFTWAMAIVQSRAFFLEGALRLIPLLDMVNHAPDDEGEEVRSGYMGALRTIQGAELVADRSYKAGEQVYCSYGPKSAVDYLLEYGFVPEQCWKTNLSQLTLEVDPEDRFYDDKLDILEFETYDSAPMDPSQSFDLVAGPGRNTGEPDPALIQFARLCQLGGTDAFLLESIFRKDVWGFMSLPVSEGNELAVVNAITETCRSAVAELDECPEDYQGVAAELLQKIRESERLVLQKTMDFLKREKEALDLKEYYQERRLKDLGLDSEWSPDDDMGGGGDDDLGFGQTRLPGGADYDW